MLTARKEGRKAHALFCLGFLGLLLSKEPAVALAVPLLVFYWGLAIVKGSSEKKIAVALALTAAISVVLWRITVALEMADAKGMYYVPTRPLLDRFSENAPTILKGLFQYEVSAAITAGFIILLLSLMVAAFAKISRRKSDGEFAFVILLLGEFASMFLALSISFGVQPRYWSVLIPLLASLLAFSVKFLLEAAKRNSAFASCTAIALIVFAGFFVSANYYDFLHQFIIQHSNRNVEDSVISKVASLLNKGQYVQAHPSVMNAEQLTSLDGNYNYLKYWPNSPYGEDSIHNVPPSNPAMAYYILHYSSFDGEPGVNGFGVHANLIARSDYGVLDCAAKVSGFLQGKAPHTTLDSIGGYLALGEYSWVIFAVPKGANRSEQSQAD